MLIFLKFNFPKAKIFLGDSGSYFLGAFIAISTIETSIANPMISPFYFCILMFYLRLTGNLINGLNSRNPGLTEYWIDLQKDSE